MTRTEAFETLFAHVYYGPVAKRLLPEEKKVCLKILKDHNIEDGSDFAIYVNRLWLNDESRPKNYRLIIELLTVANSIWLRENKAKK